jgi:hypothetical protein
MMRLLALRNFVHKPWRSALLFLGFGLGVSVMIILLSIGGAMVTQAEDERLIGGGRVTVLPEGIDIEVMKTGGLGGLFFSIANARFLYLQLLAAPRLASSVKAVAPQIDDALLYMTTPDGVERIVRAAGDIPSAQRAVGVPPTLAAGAWVDDSTDRRWIAPTQAELENDIDHFHRPPTDTASARTWAEWHYFNVVSADRRRWVFVTLMATGAGPDSGRVLVTMHEDVAGSDHERRFTATVPASALEYSTTMANLRVGRSSVTVLPDGRYAVHAVANESRGATAVVDLVVAPVPRDYLPGSNLSSGTFLSGYVVPGLAANASGTICIARACQRYDGAQSYHDHNWGVWRGVTWEWGSARMGQYAVLYGRVRPPDSVAASASSPLFVYLVDSLGFRALFRPGTIVYDDRKIITVNGRPIHVPAHAVMTDVRSDGASADSLRLELDIDDATGTYTPGLGREQANFIQMIGRARLSGRVSGGELSGEGIGFFETYR